MKKLFVCFGFVWLEFQLCLSGCCEEDELVEERGFSFLGDLDRGIKEDLVKVVFAGWRWGRGKERWFECVFVGVFFSGLVRVGIVEEEGRFGTRSGMCGGNWIE